MNINTKNTSPENWPILSEMPRPGKALVTMVIISLTVGMMGALGQIVIHDIIPVFFSSKAKVTHEAATPEKQSVNIDSHENGIAPERGDLFSVEATPPTATAPPPFYKTEQFVWTFKWTHIHLFGMSMIFIFVGGVTIFLNISRSIKTWLVILPFVGVWIDIASMWLKGFVSPVFFWLHIPGGIAFGAIFIFVSLRALWEMWLVDTT